MILSFQTDFGKTLRPHRHDIHEMIVCLTPWAQLVVNGQKYGFARGRIFVLEAGAEHCFEVLQGRNAKANIICFDEQAFAQNLPPSIQSFRKIIFSSTLCSQKNQLRAVENVALSDKMIAQSKSGRSYSEEICGSILSLLLLNYLDTTQPNSGGQVKTHEQKIDKSLRWIDDNISTKITIDLAAKNAAMSRAVFTKEFRQRTNMSLTEYVARTRIKKSVHLLGDPNYSIAEIAAMTGFNNLGYFYKCFQRHYAMTPNRVRKLIFTQGNIDSGTH